MQIVPLARVTCQILFGQQVLCVCKRKEKGQSEVSNWNRPLSLSLGFSDRKTTKTKHQELSDVPPLHQQVLPPVSSDSWHWIVPVVLWRPPEPFPGTSVPWSNTLGHSGSWHNLTQFHRGDFWKPFVCFWHLFGRPKGPKANSGLLPLQFHSWATGKSKSKHCNTSSATSEQRAYQPAHFQIPVLAPKEKKIRWMLVSPACTLSTIRSASCRILVALSCSSCFSLRAFFAFAWFLSEWTNKGMSSAIMCLQRTSLLFQLECGFLRIWNKSISNKKSQSRLSLSPLDDPTKDDPTKQKIKQRSNTCCCYRLAKRWTHAHKQRWSTMPRSLQFIHKSFCFSPYPNGICLLLLLPQYFMRFCLYMQNDWRWNKDGTCPMNWEHLTAFAQKCHPAKLECEAN